MQDTAAQHTVEAIAASTASKSMYTGAGITLGGDTVEVTAVNYDARIYLDDDNSPPV